MNQQTQQGKNGYLAFYRGKKLEVWASTSYEAQKIAAEKFRAKKSYEVDVYLCEQNGKQVVHTPDF